LGIDLAAKLLLLLHVSKNWISHPDALCTCCLFPSAFFLALDPSGCLRFFCVCASFTISSTYNSRIAAVKETSKVACLMITEEH
jgi:hypothetical protein